MKKLILLLAFLSFNIAVYSQITFKKAYGGNKDDKGYSVAQTFDGGYIITGFKTISSVDLDAILIKTNAYGDLVWSKTLGEASWECGNSVAQLSDSGYIITGYHYTWGFNQSELYLFRTKANGDTLWTKSLGDFDNPNYGNSVLVTMDSGYIITGQTQKYGGSRVFLIKTDANGDSLWSKTYGEGVGCSIVHAPDSGFAIAGGNENTGGVFLIRIDSHGDTLWSKTYGSGHNSFGYSVVRTYDDGYAIAGFTNRNGIGVSDFYLIRTNSNGDSLWTKNYGGGNYDYGRSIAQTSDSGFIITGQANSFTVGSAIYLIKTDINGDTLWTRIFYGQNDEGGMCVKQTDDGGYAITGFIWSTSLQSNYNIVLIKTDSNGIVNSTSGFNENNFPNQNFTISPNPFTTSTLITLNQTYRRITLEVYNLQGQRVAQYQYANCDKIQLMRNQLSNGLYFLKLTLDDKRVETGKIVVANE